MTSIFSQLIKGVDVDYIYDCGVLDDNIVIFTKRLTTSEDNISEIKIDFLKLRELIRTNDKIYETKDLIIIIYPDIYNIYIKKHEGNVLILEITLSKIFLYNAYKALEQLWLDD